MTHRTYRNGKVKLTGAPTLHAVRFILQTVWVQHMAITFELVPEELDLKDPLFVGAFMNWPDASMGASGAVRYLIEKLNAAPLATWDADEYYDFVELRPVSRVIPPRDRTLIWPQVECWVVREVPIGSAVQDLLAGAGLGGQRAPEGNARSLILFLAHEPRLRWRAFGRELTGFLKRCNAKQAVFFGSAWADVPHTRTPIVTGWATEPRLRTRLEALGISFSEYQGPSSMQSAAIEACRQEEIACVSLFSNGPHYLPVPNANLSLALLRRLAAVFMLDFDLQPLQEAGEALTRQANSAMEERTEFRDHVRQLEQQFDAQGEALAPGEVRRGALRAEQEDTGPLNVDPQDVVRELEDFLRRRNQGNQGETPETPDDENRPET
jgi:hypothetical protein